MKTERVKKKRKKIHCDIAPLSDSFHRRTPCAESPLFGLSTIDPQPTRELGRKEFGVLHRRNVGQGKGLPHGEDRWVPCFVQGFWYYTAATCCFITHLGASVVLSWFLILVYSVSTMHIFL